MVPLPIEALHETSWVEHCSSAGRDLSVCTNFVRALYRANLTGDRGVGTRNTGLEKTSYEWMRTYRPSRDYGAAIDRMDESSRRIVTETMR